MTIIKWILITVLSITLLLMLTFILSLSGVLWVQIILSVIWSNITRSQPDEKQQNSEDPKD